MTKKKSYEVTDVQVMIYIKLSGNTAINLITKELQNNSDY